MCSRRSIFALMVLDSDVANIVRGSIKDGINIGIKAAIFDNFIFYRARNEPKV